jgi:hypothetical protein
LPDEILQKLPRPVGRADSPGHIEQRPTLLTGKGWAPRSWRVSRHNSMKSCDGQIIVPTLGIAAHEAPCTLSIIRSNEAERIEPLSTFG